MVRRITTMLLAALTFIGAVATTPTASAQDGPHLVSTERIDAQFLRIHVYSPAHNAVIPNDILVPEGNAPRPTLYLLPGYYGGTDGLTWANTTDYRNFFRDKNVNVVSPIGGKGSLYSDWYQDDPILGRNKWTTYLTQELPSVIDREFNGTGRDAVAGLSMSGGPALDIAAHNPGRFKAAATYSGCPMSSGVVGSPLAAGLVLGTGGNIGNAWGPPWDPAWPNQPDFATSLSSWDPPPAYPARSTETTTTSDYGAGRSWLKAQPTPAPSTSPTTPVRLAST